MGTLNASVPSTSALHSLREALRRHPLLSFFCLAYAFSWIMSVPIVLSEWGYLPAALFVPLFAIKPFVGPCLAAFIMTAVSEGREGTRLLRRRIFQARAGLGWYLLILLGVPALYLLGTAAIPGALAGFQGLPHNSWLYFLVSYLINFVLIFFAGGPLGEEPGWRGFALPRMQQRFGPLGGALLLGVVWAFWHLPDFLTRAQGGGPGTGWAAFLTNLPLFTLMVVAISILMTWVYNHTRGSLFIAILLHAAINTTSVFPALFSIPGMSAMMLGNLAMLIAMGVPAVLILVLTRGRLGYQQLMP